MVDLEAQVNNMKSFRQLAKEGKSYIEELNNRKLKYIIQEQIKILTKKNILNNEKSSKLKNSDPK